METGADLIGAKADICPLQGRPLSVDYHGVGLGSGEGILLCFSANRAAPQAFSVQAAPPSPAVQRGTPGVHYSYLMMAVEFSIAGGEARSVALNEKLVKLIGQRLSQRILQADRFQYLGQGLFGAVIAHRTPESAYAAARQLAVLVSSLGENMAKVQIICSSSLTPIDDPSAREKSMLLTARKGALVAKRKGQNYIYLSDRQQLMPARPAAKP